MTKDVRPPRRKFVGTGITSYRREETLYDDPYRSAVHEGEAVPTTVRMDPARSIVNLRQDIEATCNRVFAEYELPPPLSMIHPDMQNDPFDWASTVSLGAGRVETLYDLGYELSAKLHCPEEDHSDLWYAARMAIVLAIIDLKSDVIQTHPKHHEEIALLTQYAVELGKLESEFRIKKDNEKNALRGKSVAEGNSAGGQATSEKHRDARAIILERMQAFVDEGKSVSRAAELTYGRGKGSSPDANRKLWNRHKRKK